MPLYALSRSKEDFVITQPREPVLCVTCHEPMSRFGTERWSCVTCRMAGYLVFGGKADEDDLAS